MAYKVRLTRPAEDDAYAAYDSIRIQEESEEGPRVRVLRIRHASRDAITAEAIQTALYNNGRKAHSLQAWDMRPASFLRRDI